MFDVRSLVFDVPAQPPGSSACMPDLVSIIIPAYEEERRLPPTLEQLAEWKKRCTFPVEVVIVVEPGKDRTREIATAAAAREPNIRVLTPAQQRGKGHAVREGMRAAEGTLLFYMDADLSVPLREVEAFVEYFRAHPEAEVLAGNRQHARSRITRAQSPLRQRLGQTFNLLLRARGLATLHDTQCGFKAFRRGAAQAIFARQRIDGFAFDVEVLLLAQQLGSRVVDLPVEWVNSPESKVRLFRDSARMLWDAWRVCYHRK
jgi:dolichyl-phosphate beta-glucosyltransferase